MSSFIVLYILICVFGGLTSLSEEGKLPKGWNKKDTWKDKYTNQIPNWLDNYVLAFITDPFHFFQFLYLTTIQLTLATFLTSNIWYVLAYLIAFKLIWGIIVEVLRHLTK